jgi:hypothetical protein
VAESGGAPIERAYLDLDAEAGGSHLAAVGCIFAPNQCRHEWQKPLPFLRL